MSRRPNPATALQREVRAAGAITRDLRFSWKVFGICGVPALALVVLAAALPNLFEVSPALSFALWFPLGLACAVVGVLLLVLPVTACYRDWRTQGIRRTMGDMSPEERAVALEPLRSDESAEARELAAALLREFGVAGEVSPAPAPEGRGDEPAGQ